ncbi:MAG TPA: SDR family oxidoreductase [Ferruginibacter sp.]|jgi:short-subunit dehydrogenase|nr:SDR family oxidoreductase [Ferruginibacter sp.]
MNIVITGASKGIGKAIAEVFAMEGATLFLCARNELVLYNAVAELQTKYPNSTIKAKAADLSIKEEAQKFGQWILGFGIPTIVVNNAGQFLPGNISTEEDGLLEHTIAANLYSAYHLTRVLVSKMIEAKQGHVFNVCSIASLQAYKNGGSYSISKFALMGFSKNLREELKPFNIKVTSVYPGAVMTDSWAGFDNSAGRIMEAGDIAKMILAASKLSPQAVVEDIILRPQLGDL